MIQIEYGVKVDGEHYILLLDDDDADEVERQLVSLNDLEVLFVSKNVMLTSSQNSAFNNFKMVTIPDYYFSFELKEAGESW